MEALLIYPRVTQTINDSADRWIPTVLEIADITFQLKDLFERNKLAHRDAIALINCPNKKCFEKIKGIFYQQIQRKTLTATRKGNSLVLRYEDKTPRVKLRRSRFFQPRRTRMSFAPRPGTSRVFIIYTPLYD